MEEIVYKIETFEGPLDLLLSLISKNKMDIRNIQIFEICEQYMAYIEQAKKLDMDLAGEFITMAAELMLIKSKMLLPRQTEDPKEELVQRLMEYQAAKEAAKDLGEKENEFKGRYYKDTDELKPIISEDFRIDSVELIKALHGLFLKLEEERASEKERLSTPVVPLAQYKVKSVKESCDELMKVFEKRKAVHFDDVFDGAKDRQDIISTFYAMLELIRLGKLLFERKEEGYSGNDIILRVNENYVETEDNIILEENEDEEDS